MSDKLLLIDEEIAKLKRNSPQFSERGRNLANILDKIQQGKIQSLSAGVEGINLAVAITYNVTTGAAEVKIFDGDAPFKFEVVAVEVQPRGASTNGTMKLTDGTNDITDPITCAVDKTTGRQSTIDDAYSTIDKNGSLSIVCAGDTVASTIGLVTIWIIAKD